MLAELYTNWGALSRNPHDSIGREAVKATAFFVESRELSPGSSCYGRARFGVGWRDCRNRWVRLLLKTIGLKERELLVAVVVVVGNVEDEREMLQLHGL